MKSPPQFEHHPENNTPTPSSHGRTKTTQSQASDLRERHLQERSTYYEELRQVEPRHILKQIIHTEESQQL